MAGKRLFIFHLVDDLDVFHRTPMIRAFAKNAVNVFDVLCVSPPVSFASFFGRRKLGNFKPGRLDRIGENLFHFLPHAIEGRAFYSLIGRTDRYYERLAEQIRRLPIFSRYWGGAVNWIYRMEQKATIDNFNGLPYVYECYDEYTRELSTGREIQGSREAEISLMKGALLTFTTSHELFESKGKLSKNVHLCPNGVDLSHFDRKFERRAPLKRGALTVGYVGNVSGFLDYALIEGAIKSLPDCSFVFVGQVTSNEAKRLKKFNNVRFEGYVERRYLPEIIASFDVALIPFKVNEAMNAVNPLKLWEYFAARKIVVSTPIKELLKYDDVIYFAKSAGDYARTIKEALTSDNRSRIEKGRQLAEEHSWDNLTRTMIKTCSEKLT